MMFLLGVVVLQDPPVVQAQEQVVQRVWKPNQKDRYKVSIDITDKGGDSHTNFTLELRAPKIPPKEGEVRIEALYLDQFINFGPVKKQNKGGFGTANLQFPPSGMPVGILGKGQVAALMMPLMAWFVPEKAGAFSIAGYRTDDGVSIDGTGEAGELKGKEWLVTTTLSLKDGTVPMGTLATKAWFEPKTVRLIRADGTYTAKEGSAKFTIR